MYEHTGRPVAGTLPPQVWAALAHEPADERAALQETWALAHHYLDGEPDEATFRSIGAEIWPTLEAALHQETRPAATPQFPMDVWATLAHEPADERAALQETWALAHHYLDGEPDEATFRSIGAEMWPALEAALHQEIRRDRQPLRLVQAPLRLVQAPGFRWAAMAACLALLISVGVLLSMQPVSVQAPFGETAHLELPDGSDVILNSGTTLRYSRHFDEETRSVQLDGEAFFAVEHGAAPFTVETFNGTTTVLGTTFNVRAWADDLAAATRVDLLEGRVRFFARNTGASLTLNAGETAILAAAGIAPVIVDEASIENAVSWRDGAFKFVNAPLGTVADEIERRYDVRIDIRPQHLRTLPVAILKENPLGVEEILRDIAEYNAYEIRAISGGFEIYQPDGE